MVVPVLDCLRIHPFQAWPTFHSWMKKYDGLGTEDLRRLRQLEEENAL